MPPRVAKARVAGAASKEPGSLKVDLWPMSRPRNYLARRSIWSPGEARKGEARGDGRQMARPKDAGRQEQDEGQAQKRAGESW